MYEIVPMLTIDSIILGISSYQDIKQKSVDDIIIYVLFLFNIFFFLFLILLGYYPKNLFLSYIIFIFFILLYYFRLLAIGDLYIFFSIFLLLSFFSIKNILSFFLYLFIIGFLFHNLEGTKIFYKRNRKYFYLSIINIFIIIISLIFLYLFFNFFSLYYLLIFLFLFYLSYFIFKIFEKELKDNLVFKRKPDELVEGDWINDKIEVDYIKEEDMNKVKEYFDVEKSNKYIIKFKKEKFFHNIFPIFLSILPLPFYFFYQNYFYISLIIVLIIFHVFQNKIFKGKRGLSKEEIEILKKLSEYNNIIVEVTEGAPFVPPIFLAMILSII